MISEESSGDIKRKQDIKQPITVVLFSPDCRFCFVGHSSGEFNVYVCDDEWRMVDNKNKFNNEIVAADWSMERNILLVEDSKCIHKFFEVDKISVVLVEDYQLIFNRLEWRYASVYSCWQVIIV